MASEQNISMQSKVKPPDHRKIVSIVRNLASSSVYEQRSREALHILIELDTEVDKMLQSGPLTAEMQRDICMLSLRYPGQNLFWNSKSVVNIPTLQRCSDICKSMNIKHQYSNKINQLTSANITVLDCQLFSYSLSNTTCWIKYREVHDLRRPLGYWRF